MQAEALLCEIEKAAPRYSPADTWAIIQTDKNLMDNDLVRSWQASGFRPEDYPGKEWLIGAAARLKWSGVLQDAIACGEIRSFDPFLLPITPPDADKEAPLPTSRAHVSDKLAYMKQAAAKFWENADRDDRGTHPANATVTAWLVQQGFSQTLADKAATIIRPEWAPTGRKPEE